MKGKSAVADHAGAIAAHAAALGARPTQAPALAVVPGQSRRELFAEAVLSDAYRLYGRGGDVYNPSKLVSRDNYATLTKMRSDEQIKAALSLKKHAVIASGWNFHMPAEIADQGGTEKDWAPCLLVRRSFDEIATGMAEVLLQTLLALDYGFSVGELVFGPSPWPDLPGLIALKALKSKRPDQFVFVTDQFGNVTEIKQPALGGVDRSVPLGKIVVFRHQAEFGNPYGIPDLEAAYDYWFHKRNAWRWAMQLCERYGVPPAVVIYDQAQVRDQTLTSLQDVLKNWGSVNAMTIPRADAETIQLEFPEVAGQVASIFVPLLEKLNTDIARALLMPGLLGVTSETTTGSYARARVQFDVFMLVVEKLRTDLERVINEQVVRPLIDLNFGAGPYPLFKLNPVSQDLRLDVMQTWSALVGAGVVHSLPRDEVHLRQQLEFPEATEEEIEALEEARRAEEAARKAKEEARAVGQRDEPDPDMPMDGDDEMPGAGEGMQNMTGAVARSVAPAQEGTLHLHVQREPTPYERSVNFALVRRDLDEAEASATESIRRALENARARWLKKLRPVVEARDVRRVKTMPAPGMAAVERVIGEFLTRTWDAGRGSARRDLGRERTFTFAQDVPNVRPASALRYLETKRFWITGVLADNLLRDARAVLLAAIDAGEPAGDTMRKLRDVFLPYVGDETVLRDDGPIRPARLETIVRTNATDAYNRGRLVEFRDNPEAVPFVEYSAIIDDRTTRVCRLLDGRVFRADDPEIDRIKPPNHFNCRSILVPVTPDIPVSEADLASEAVLGEARDLVATGFGGEA